MEISFSTIMDLVFFSTLVASSIWLFIILTGYEGLIGKSFKLIGWGALVFGFARILEKFLLQFFGSYFGFIELAVHFFEALSFLLILYGFKIFLGK
ncbi:hypothetical protein KKG48_01770 [Patescibacteria group bacterium]|nr:hypothetical protein [Patescibacteria group bacterium]MCG2694591.1 hypothetical protein [Candidatus Parcubacteria bacterium]